MSRCKDCGDEVTVYEFANDTYAPDRCDDCALDKNQKEELPDARKLRKNLRKSLEGANFPAVFRSPEVDKPEHEQIRSFVERNYPAERNGMLIYGHSDRSKTEESCGAAKWYTKRRLSNGSQCDPYFLTGLAWINDRLGGGCEHSLSRVKSADILVVDDLGKETTSRNDAVNAQLHLLINQRCNSGLPTIFTANATIDQLANHPSYNKTTINRLRWMTGDGDQCIRLRGGDQ